MGARSPRGSQLSKKQYARGVAATNSFQGPAFRGFFFVSCTYLYFGSSVCVFMFNLAAGTDSQGQRLLGGIAPKRGNVGGGATFVDAGTPFLLACDKGTELVSGTRRRDEKETNAAVQLLKCVKCIKSTRAQKATIQRQQQ